MPTKGKPVPDGYRTVTPYLIIRDAGRAIDFYKTAFGAEEVCRMPGPGGKVMHAEIRIGDSMVMMGDENPQMNAQSPLALKGTSTSIMLYVENVDATFNRALKAGAQTLMPVTDMFWGDRFGKLRDPFGHEWAIATHIWDLTPEEMQKAQAAAFCPEQK